MQATSPINLGKTSHRITDLDPDEADNIDDWEYDGDKSFSYDFD